LNRKATEDAENAKKRKGIGLLPFLFFVPFVSS